MARSPSVLSSWTQVIVDALDAQGHDSAALLTRVGLDRRALSIPSTRHSLATTRALWHAAVAAFDEPACGLTVSRYVRPTTFSALGYAVAASVDLRQALDLLLRYSRVVSDASEFRLEILPDRVRVIILPYSEHRGGTRLGAHGRPVGPETVDALMSLLVRTCRWLAGRATSPLLVEQRRARPSDCTPYDRFFRCPLQFGAAEDALTFLSSSLDRRLPGGNSTLSRHNEELVKQHLAKVEAGDLCDRVRDVLEASTLRDATPAQVARALRMTERTLQRHLQQAGTTFAELLTASRRELACTYLREAHWSIEEIALLLGFNSASGFARAFRSWTLLSPTAFRETALSATGEPTTKV